MGITFEIEPILARVGLADTDLFQSYQFGFAVSPAKMLLTVAPTVLFLNDLDAGWSRPRPHFPPIRPRASILTTRLVPQDHHSRGLDKHKRSNTRRSCGSQEKIGCWIEQ